jgi:hypothetical protein
VMMMTTMTMTTTIMNMNICSADCVKDGENKDDPKN